MRWKPLPHSAAGVLNRRSTDVQVVIRPTGDGSVDRRRAASHHHGLLPQWHAQDLVQLSAQRREVPAHQGGNRELNPEVVTHSDTAYNGHLASLRSSLGRLLRENVDVHRLNRYTSGASASRERPQCHARPAEADFRASSRLQAPDSVAASVDSPAAVRRTHLPQPKAPDRMAARHTGG